MKVFRFKIVGPSGILFILISLFGCARIVAPTGGPKDITPPKVVKCVPPNFSPDFKANQFSITFDEYIEQPSDFNQQVLISPPMEKIPTYKLKRKTLTIHLESPLNPNTTYTINFGQSIKDLTEGNILNNFSYVFSTGKYVDSLSLRGQVLSALDHKPEKDITVMLYKNNNDTLPLKALPLHVKPFYVSKTNKKGKFLFSGLKDTCYLLFALKDMDYSLTYNLATEKVAFSDSLVHPQYRKAPVFDSALFKKLIHPKMKRDSVKIITDSLHQMADSIATSRMANHKLYLFLPADTVPRLLKLHLAHKNILEFAFNFPADSVVKIFSLKYAPPKRWFKPEWNAGKDTLLWYLKTPHPDSLQLLVMEGKDTLGLKEVAIVPPKKFRLLRKHKKKVVIEYLGGKPNLKDIIKPGQKLEITFNQPVGRLRFDSVLLVNEKDSIYDPPHYFADSIHRTLVIPFKVEPDKHYKVNFPDSSVFDWNGHYNISFSIVLRSEKTKEYGILRFDLGPEKKGHYIFQLLTPTGEVLESRYFSSATELVFDNVTPGSYGFRIIFDRNDNKKWDTGNYIHHLQPEKVIYYSKIISVRANWEIDENWSF